MKANEFRKLEKYQQEVARLQRDLAKFNRRLARLPAQYGFRSMDEFIVALRQVAATSANAPAKAAKRRKRATITAETKQKVKTLFAAQKTGKEISAALGISLPSVQNIKRELGLIKKRT